MCLPSFLERAPIGLKDTVLLVHRFDTAKLIKACEEEELNVLTEKGGLFDKLCTLYHLDDTLGCDIELVTFGLSAFVHFSELCWVVNAAKLYPFDSCTGAGHADITSTAIQPFIEYAIDRCPFIEPNELQMANNCDIQAQPKDSNICAFSASLCLGKVLSATLNTFSSLTERSDEGIDLASMGFSKALCNEMDSIKTTTTMYKISRTQAAHALNKLSAEYMVKEKAKQKAQKAKALTGKKREIPPEESSDDSSEPPSDDEDD
jgi:hypothetical protein